MTAFKMPKETEEQKKKRSAAIQEGYKVAASVPLKTAKTCEEIFDISIVIAEKGNQNSITDAAISALMAQAGVEGAILNVKINLGSIKDEVFVKEISSELDKLQEGTTKKTEDIIKLLMEKYNPTIL
jgi:formiminotetrahydrofolate cyclodeaminase